jgi:polyvinyl alcohol dehydrogenase (cytochrome)
LKWPIFSDAKSLVIRTRNANDQLMTNPWLVQAAGIGIFVTLVLVSPTLAQQNGAELYSRNCARCHDQGSSELRAPNRNVMSALTADEILRELDGGVMASVSNDLSRADKIAIAEFLSGKQIEQKPVAVRDSGRCGDPPHALAWGGPQWNGWGNSATNGRFQSAAAAAITPENVSNLKLKWAFGFQGAFSANAQPTVVGGSVFVGGGDRKVYSLDARTGCTYWAFATDAVVRTAISVGPSEGSDDHIVYFGDLAANAYAVNASSGALVWKTKVETHPAARITGAPTLYSGVLYVPLSSIEEGTGSRSGYECCTFRGSVVALDARTGREIWKTYTIAEEPRPTKTNAVGTQLYGPSGAAVWSAPTIDANRRALYVATGNSYSNPPTDTSDAVIALDLNTGTTLWHQQATPNDSYVVGCYGLDRTNCPDDHGPDHDFGQSPILATLADGQRMLVVGQKSGVVHALDPDRQGKFLWQTRIGKGGPLGGIMWGSAADQDHVYVANSDVRFLPGGSRQLDPHAGGGLFSLDLASGKIAWSAPPFVCGARKQCSPALSAAVTVVPGVVFSGGVSGLLRAYATTDGRLLWEVDTTGDHSTVNGVVARGGAMEGPGPTIVDGMLFVNSGYGLWGGLSGNVLLAFSVKDD